MATENQQRPWQDPTLPTADRVAALLAQMTLEEKVAQLYGVWVGIDPNSDDVAPHQHDLADPSLDFASLTRFGLGQVTRPFGTAPVDPADGAKALARLQADIIAANRFGIPALAHEECLTGFMTWQATVYPTPLAWGATFDPELVERMAAQIGATMRSVGVHQGLAPVLDVARDHRWGRVEETMGEDPYLVATLGTRYVRGLESAGIVATLKHFVGYSASTGGRNHGPVAIGTREFADVLLPPFEMAIHDGGARSVMQSYAEIDGVPVCADGELLTRLLRDVWGFTGTVVSDYFGVSFLEIEHGVAGSPAEAAALALTAGLDVELPAVRCFGEPLLAALREGRVDEALVDRAATRVLTQKCELGLLDADWSPMPPALRESGGGVDFDPPAGQEIAQRLAEESVVLLANDGALPLRPDASIAVVGPLADDQSGMFGCYAFPSHMRFHYEHRPSELADAIPTVLAALRSELPGAKLSHAPGGEVTVADPRASERSSAELPHRLASGAEVSDAVGFTAIEAAVDAAAAADVCVAVLGDKSGLFGRGTSGEGCDAEHLGLPGQQEQLLAALLDTGTPVVAVLLAGRPYALGAVADRLAAIVQAFFPGQAGGAAVAGVLSGRVNPSGRLPVSLPRTPHAPPGGYLRPLLAHKTAVSSVDPTPLFPFGHGLSYTSFAWEDVAFDPAGPGAVGRRGATAGGALQVATDGTVTVSVRVRNTGDRAGAEVVQLYLHDPVAQVTRPVVRLVGYARVPLAAGEARRVTLRMHADLASFTGRDGRRIVEPGTLELRLGSSCIDTPHVGTVELVGPQRVVDHRRRLTTEVTVE